MCLGLEPRVVEWKAQTNPLSYGGTPSYTKLHREEKIFFALNYVFLDLLSREKCGLHQVSKIAVNFNLS